MTAPPHVRVSESEGFQTPVEEVGEGFTAQGSLVTLDWTLVTYQILGALTSYPLGTQDKRNTHHEHFKSV